jgi:hypothetical protein
MNKIWNWLDKGHSKSAYELMTNQIYTAVLGSIIYMLFDWCFNLYYNKIDAPDYLVRTMFLIIGVVFYLSDYYYIKGSNPYRNWHFVFDIIFMFCMLYSTKLLGLNSQSENTNLSPNVLKEINVSYIIFLILYLIWDIRELIDIWIKSKEQRKYYYEVVVWQTISIFTLFIIYLRQDGNPDALIIALSLSTTWFCFLSYRKQELKSIF